MSAGRTHGATAGLAVVCLIRLVDAAIIESAASMRACQMWLRFVLVLVLQDLSIL